MTKLIYNGVKNMSCSPNYLSLVEDRVSFVQVTLIFKFAIIISLLLHWDIERNPGPLYNIEKTDLASFHQGHVRFRATTWVLCACQ